MKKTNKKGFTIVELVIVIAVIAILAAVLIPNISRLVKKANQSADIQLVRNMNTALQIDGAGTKTYNTMHEALEAVKEAGYDVEKIAKSDADNVILWDSVNQCFALLVDGKGEPVYYPDTNKKDTAKYQLWKVVDSKEEAEKSEYSVYWTGEETELNIKNVGFDAGTKTVDVNYSGDKSNDVTIRTNGGTLTVNAASDTVRHFDKADKVVITAVAPHSYYENGEVQGNIELANGHVVMAKGAKAAAIRVTATADLITAGTATIAVDTTAANTVAVVVPEDVKTAIEASTSADNKITADKVISKDDDIKTLNYFAGGIGTEDSPYLIATGDQAYNMRNGKGYFKLIDDVVVTNEIYLSAKTVVLDLNGHSIRLEYADDVKPNNGGVLNISGKGGNLTINDSSEGQTGAVYGSDETYTNKVTSAVRVGNYGKLTINGGHFYGTSEGTSCIYVCTSSADSNKATVVINGGTFETASAYNEKNFVLNHQDKATAGCTITVNGGRFKNYKPGATAVDPVNDKTGKIVLGEGCTVNTEVDGNNTYYIVSKAN